MKDGTGIFYYYFLFNHFYHMGWNTAEQGSNLSMFLQITHPAQKRLATPLGSTSPTLFEQWCEFFYVPQESDK